MVIFAALVLMSMGSSTLSIVLAVGIPLAAPIARSVRAAVLAEREQEYIDAVRVRDEHAAYIMYRGILPNVFAVAVVEFTVRLPMRPS